MAFVFLCLLQNVANVDNLCVVTDAGTASYDVSGGKQQQHSLVAGQLVEVLAAPDDLVNDDVCYVRIVTSAQGRDVSADAPPLEGWVSMATLRPQTALVQGGAGVDVNAQGSS